MSRILALDPGSCKLGVCILERESRVVLLREIVAADRLAGALDVFFSRFSLDTLLLGDGTHHRRFLPVLEQAILRNSTDLDRRPELRVVGERNTTLEARELYRRDHPPRFPWNLLPRGLVPISEPIDHYAAQVIALRWLDDQAAGRVRRRSALDLS